MSPAPDPILKPKLAGWMFDRNISATKAARHLHCSKQTVLNITQPFSSSSRTVPRDDLLARIVDWTGGAVTAADFYPPHLNGQSAETTESAQ